MLPNSDRAIKAIAESKIQAAMEVGEFDNLPGLGKPFEFDDTSYDPHWWIRQKLKRESLETLFAPTPTLPDPPPSQKYSLERRPRNRHFNAS